MIAADLHTAVNRWVAGSNPARGANFLKDLAANSVPQLPSKTQSMYGMCTHVRSGPGGFEPQTRPRPLLRGRSFWDFGAVSDWHCFGLLSGCTGAILVNLKGSQRET